MKIFFTASLSGKKLYLENYRKIVEVLEGLGHKVIYEHILQKSRLEVEKESVDQATITVVIVNKGDKKAGFVIDSLIGQQEIVIKTLGKFLANIKMIAGATILGDGEVALILDQGLYMVKA